MALLDEIDRLKEARFGTIFSLDAGATITINGCDLVVDAESEAWVEEVPNHPTALERLGSQLPYRVTKILIVPGREMRDFGKLLDNLADCGDGRVKRTLIHSEPEDPQ